MGNVISDKNNQPNLKQNNQPNLKQNNQPNKKVKMNEDKIPIYNNRNR